MKHSSAPRASATPSSPHTLTLGGAWTARGLGNIADQLDALQADRSAPLQVDAAGIVQLDTAGAWVLHKLLSRLRGDGAEATLQGLQPALARLLQAVITHQKEQASAPAAAPPAPPQHL